MSIPKVNSANTLDRVIRYRPGPSHRRRIILCATTAVFMLGADFVVRQAAPVLKGYDVADYARKPGVLRSIEMPDIVLMGSSRAKYALVPSVFEAATGQSAYNLAIAGTKTVEWLTLAKQVFAEREPKLVVVGVNASEFRADYLPTAAARHLFTFADLRESIAMDGASMDVAGQYIRRRLGPLWATYDRRYELKMWGQERLGGLLPKYAQASRELRRRVADSCPPKGYDHPWIHGRQRRDLGLRLLEDRAAVVAASRPKFDRRAGPFRRLGQLLGWFHQRGIAVIVAYLPNSPETQRRWADVEPRMIDAIEAVCRERSVPFLRCSDTELPRNNHDYLDETHVGLPLAHRISSRIARRAVAMGELGEQPSRVAVTPGDDPRLP